MPPKNQTEQNEENQTEQNEGGFGWQDTKSMPEKPVPKRLTPAEVKKLRGQKVNRQPLVYEKYLVIVVSAPSNSKKVEYGDSDIFEAPDESHASRMFIQKYELDPHGDGATALYDFDVIPQFEDYRPHGPYTTDSELKRLNAYQEKRGKQPVVTNQDAK